jgi:hypothetical protein
MPDDAFFATRDGLFVPNPSCRGPWDPNSLHGRVIAGLLGAEIERRHGEPGWQPARLTVDLWRLPGFVPIEVRTDLRREGGRIRVVDAECFADSVSIGRASGVLLRQSEQPEAPVWSPPAWDMPPPETFPPEKPPANLPTNWTPMWETRSEGPTFGVAGRKRAWVREVRTLAEGQPLTPFVRVALAADLTNPLANSGQAGLPFINVDITLYLHRLPETDWVGFDVASHQSADGVAVGGCTLYDERSAIGHSLVSALAQRRRLG